MSELALSLSRPSRLMALAGAPALHFAVAGALLFAASRLAGTGPVIESAADASAREIVIDATRIRGLRRDYSLANRVVPGEAEIRALVDKLVTEEILFREAIARGFEQGDRAIGWRLVQKMRYLGEDGGEDVTTLYHKALGMGLHRSDPVVRSILVEKIRLIVGHTGPRPTPGEIESWFSSHARDYQQAARVSLRHVFFDRVRRGDDGARRAAESAAVAATGHGREIAATLGGDPFVMGGELNAQGRNDLIKFFGAAFADDALALPEGAWSAPLESTFGWHLVWISKRFDARIPELAEVRSRVEKSVEVAHQQERVAAFIERMRPAYTVRIDEDAIRGSAGG